jgi:glycosyltransferase involved in cell wall biosynthesis
MRGVVEERAAALGIKDLVRITGWASGPEVRAELLAGRAMVLPSFAEGLPVVIMEALALERPVISTYVAGIPELVDEGCGWMVPAGSVPALADAMVKCLEADAPTLAALGAEGRTRVLARHDARLAAELLEGHFAAAIAKGPGR